MIMIEIKDHAIELKKLAQFRKKKVDPWIHNGESLASKDHVLEVAAVVGGFIAGIAAAENLIGLCAHLACASRFADNLARLTSNVEDKRAAKRLRHWLNCVHKRTDNLLSKLIKDKMILEAYFKKGTSPLISKARFG